MLLGSNTSASAAARVRTFVDWWEAAGWRSSTIAARFGAKTGMVLKPVGDNEGLDIGLLLCFA
jgi:hypothetical protein